VGRKDEKPSACNVVSAPGSTSGGGETKGEISERGKGELLGSKTKRNHGRIRGRKKDSLTQKKKKKER